MRPLAMVSLVTVCIGCKAFDRQQATEPQQIEVEVRNASSSCKSTVYTILDKQTISYTIRADVVLTGDGAKDHPWAGYAQRIVNGDQSQPISAMPWVLILAGTGKFDDYYSEDRPINDSRPPPKFEYKVVALQPLSSVRSR